MSTVVVISVIFSGCLLALVGGYARIWESRQPVRNVNYAVIQSVTSYNRDSDLHWSSQGYRIYIKGESRAIDFPINNWHTSVGIGDTVNLILRPSFTWFGMKNELDGLKIEVSE